MTQSPSPRRSRGRTVKPDYTKRIVISIAVLAVLIIVGVIIYARVTPGLNDTIANLQTFPEPEAGHQEGSLTYPQTPPVGGVHNVRWQNCGIYVEPVANENAVHSMEHGAVWITYRPDLVTDQVEALQMLVRGRTHTLLTPYPNLPGTIVASAWGYQLTVDQADDYRLKQFLSQYERGPQTLEPGASCSGSLGLPTGR